MRNAYEPKWLASAYGNKNQRRQQKNKEQKESVAAKKRLSLRRNCTHHGSGKNPAADTTPVPCSTERIPCSAGRRAQSAEPCGLFFICHSDRSRPQASPPAFLKSTSY